MHAGERRRLMDAGARAFNEGRFFVAHELWEELWLELPDPERAWVQGLIQLAAALLKLAQRRADLCRALLEKALGKLDDAPPALDGHALGRLRDDVRALARRLDAGEDVLPSLTLWTT